MIEVKDIVKSFDGNVVLNHVSTTMEDGKVNMIIGQSGSGKTVLLKTLIGLHSPDSGQILYDGRDLAEMRNKDIRMLHREVGVLFQGSALFDSMSVMENVLFPMEMFSHASEAEKLGGLLSKACRDAGACMAPDAERDQRWSAETSSYCACDRIRSEIPLLRRAELRFGPEDKSGD